MHTIFQMDQSIQAYENQYSIKPAVTAKRIIKVVGERLRKIDPERVTIYILYVVGINTNYIQYKLE